MNKPTVMDSPFHKSRIKKSLMSTISELAAISLWNEMDKVERQEFIDSWKILSRPSLCDQENINHSLDMDQMMEESASQWVKTMNKNISN